MGVSIKQTQQNRGRRRRSRSHAMMSEINVTPFVDVMLVLLIIFMVSAPLLTVGVPVELPEAGGEQLESTQEEPLTVTIDKNGLVYIGETEVPSSELSDKLRALSNNRPDVPIYLLGDENAKYGQVARVLGRVKRAGFTNFTLVTEVEQEE